MRKNHGLARTGKELLELALDHDDKRRVGRRKRLEVVWPNVLASSFDLNAECVGQPRIALLDETLGVALERGGLAGCRVGCRGAARRPCLKITASARLRDDRLARIVFGTLGGRMACGRARVLARPLGFAAYLRARRAFAGGMARSIALVEAALERRTAHLAAGDAVLRTPDVLDRRVLAAGARLRGQVWARWTVGRLVTRVRRLGVTALGRRASTRVQAIDGRAAGDRRVNDRVTAVADELDQSAKPLPQLRERPTSS